MFQTQAEFDAYLEEIKGIEAPDLCERVMYQWRGKEEPDHYRVGGWYRVVPDIKPEGEMDQDYQMIWDLFEDDRVERRAKERVRIQACTREEATHVSITGVGSTVVRIDRVQRTGELVKWSPELIKQTRDSWASFYIPHGASHRVEVNAR